LPFGIIAIPKTEQSMKPRNDAYPRELRLPMSMDYSPEWMIPPVPKPAGTSIPVRERRMPVDRRRAERRHKSSD
jgi:hypothetical protein